MLVKLTKSTNSLNGILLICLATFLGTYVPAQLIKNIQKDAIYIFDIIPMENESGKVFADLIREQNLAIVTYKAYNDKLELVLCSKVYSQDKEQSRLIESLIPQEFRYSVMEVKQSQIM